MKHSSSVLTVLFAVFLYPSHFVSLGPPKRVIKILGIFPSDEVEGKLMFQHAINEANEELKRTRWDLKGDIINYSVDLTRDVDSFNLSQQLCDHLKRESGYAAVFGPEYHELTQIVKSITTAKKIPHIETRLESETLDESDIRVNFHPQATGLERAMDAVLQDMDWETFTLIYNSPESLVSLQEVLKEKLGPSKFDRPKILMKLIPNPFLKEVKNSSETRIMLHCNTANIVKILKTAKDVELVRAYQNFFVTSLDAHTLNYSEFRNVNFNSLGDANVTTLRLIDPAFYSDYVQKWNRGKNTFFNNSETVHIFIKTSTALIRDAVLHFTQTLKDMPSNFTTSSIDCFTSDEWEYGVPFVHKMKTIESIGLSGRMGFDVSTGSRNYFSLGIIEVLGKGGIRELGAWYPDKGVKYLRNLSQIEEEKSLENKTLRVASKLVPPYLFLKNDTENGHVVYDGFCKELLDELAKWLKFNYTLYIPENSEPGDLVPETGRYTGLIGELTEYKAEMAICDFTITPDRKKAVDFTASFMSLGISILYTVAPAREASYFSFLDPFDVTVWLYLATAYLGLSITLYIVGRCSPYEWEGTHPCDEDPDELENPWNLQTCLWLGIGVLLQQGCDILPKGFSARLVVSTWCFFTLIVTSTYTANLAAFLTTQRMESPIKSVEDLANQNEVKYGCLKNGATANFFKLSNDSLYQRMWATMEASNPSVFCEKLEQGVERVLRSKHKYAFFMESVSIEYEMKLHCELDKIGGQLDSKFYGIAVPIGASYRDVLTTGILQLTENAVIDKLKEKWWPDIKNCDRSEDEDKDKLGLRNVGGVFFVLMLGCIVSFFVSFLEFLWNVRKVAVKEKIPLSQAFWLELKFACKCHQTAKPVRYKLQDDHSLDTLASGIPQLRVDSVTVS